MGFVGKFDNWDLFLFGAIGHERGFRGIFAHTLGTRKIVFENRSNVFGPIQEKTEFSPKINKKQVIIASKSIILGQNRC